MNIAEAVDHSLRTHSLQPYIKYPAGKLWYKADPIYSIGGQEVRESEFNAFCNWVRSGVVPTLTNKVNLADKPKSTIKDWAFSEQVKPKLEFKIVGGRFDGKWFACSRNKERRIVHLTRGYVHVPIFKWHWDRRKDERRKVTAETRPFKQSGGSNVIDR